MVQVRGDLGSPRLQLNNNIVPPCLDNMFVKCMLLRKVVSEACFVLELKFGPTDSQKVKQ
jgi:hypothetical protein